MGPSLLPFESVKEGQPARLVQDPDSKVAYETGTKTNTVPVTWVKYLDEIIFCLQKSEKYQKKKYLVVGENYLDEKTIFHLNPSPCFLIGGPHSTGKIAAKTSCHFGIEGPHGDAALPGHQKMKTIIIIIIIVVIGAVVVVVIVICEVGSGDQDI